MKITDVRWTPAFIPIESPLRYAFGAHPGFSRIIIEVQTDEGLVGLGECYGGFRPGGGTGGGGAFLFCREPPPHGRNPLELAGAGSVIIICFRPCFFWARFFFLFFFRAVAV